MLRYTGIFISLLLRFFFNFYKAHISENSSAFFIFISKSLCSIPFNQIANFKKCICLSSTRPYSSTSARKDYIEPVHHECQFNKGSFLRYRTSVKHIFLYDSKKGLTGIGEIGTQYGKHKDITERQHR